MWVYGKEFIISNSNFGNHVRAQMTSVQGTVKREFNLNYGGI